MAEPLRSLRATALDRALLPLHRWVWQDPGRRALKLLRFAETEADGGRDLSRAAEVTRDPLLRRLYLRHAQDEERHAHLFRARGRELLHSLPRGGSVSFEANFFAPESAASTTSMWSPRATNRCSPSSISPRRRRRSGSSSTRSPSRTTPRRATCSVASFTTRRST